MLYSINPDLAAALACVVFVLGLVWLFHTAVYQEECSPRTLVCAAVITTTTLTMRLSAHFLEYLSPVVYALFIVIAFTALKRMPVPQRIVRFLKL